MAAKSRRGASRGRRRRKQSSPLVWAIGGLLAGLLIAWLVWINMLAPRPTAPAKQQPPPKTESMPIGKRMLEEPIVIPKPEKPPYDFYHDLSRQTVTVPADEARPRDDTGPLLLPSKPPASGGKQAYILQVGSFRKLQQADRMKAKLALLGFKARIEKVRVSDGVWHRVRLGPFDSMEQANQMRSRLAAQKIKGMLLKIGQ